MARNTKTPGYLAESSAPYALEKIPVTGASDVYSLTSDIRTADREHLVVLYLNIRNRVIMRETVAIGTLAGVESSPREIFKSAIIHSAAAIILVHNHPSGDPAPSQADMDFTTRIADAGKIIGIKLLDHVIVAEHGYYSHAAHGLVR